MSPTISTTSSVVVEHLQTVFTRFCLPGTIVSNNRSCFVSEGFSAFLLENGVKCITSAPYQVSGMRNPDHQEGL